jgi:hypothetical protein
MNTRRAAVIVIVVTLIALAPVVPHEFVSWDDNFNIVRNPHVVPPSLSGLAYVWTHEWMHLWVPLTYTVWIAIAAIKFDPHVFHAINVLGHTCAAAATLCLLRRLRFSVVASMFGALVFAIHPVQVESVAWISGLKDVLSGALCIASLLCFARGTNRKWYLTSVALYVLAMLAKPQAVALPLAGFAIDRWLHHRSPKQTLKLIAPMIVLAIPIIVIGRIAQTAVLVEHVPLWQRPFIAGEAVAFYLLKLVWPIKLGIDYGHTPQWVMQSRIGYFAWMIPLALAMLFARRGIVLLAIVVFVAALLPVLGFVPFDFQAKSTVADHYLYFAMLGVAIAVAGLCEARPKLRPLVIAIIALLSVRSFMQARTWADSRTLFTHAIAVNSDSYVAYNNLYVIAMDEQNGVEAERNARHMLALSPHQMLSTTNLAGALAMQDRFGEAEQLYREATHRWPTELDPYVGLGLVLLDQHRPADAIEAFDAALRLSPDNPQIMQLRAKAQAQQANQR